MRRLGAVSISVILGLAAGCSLRKLTVSQTADILRIGARAFDSQSDYEFAGEAAPGNLITMEGFLLASPENEDLLAELAIGYAGYAFAFLEDRMERAEPNDPDAAAALSVRARNFYLVARDFALRLQEERRDGLRAALAPGGDLAAYLRRCDGDDVEGLFWLAYAWGSAVNLARDDMALVADLPNIQAIVERVAQLDGAFYHAGPHLMLGAIGGAFPPALGGNPEAARRHFEEALRITNRKFLMVQVTYAQTLAVQIQDRALFDRLLDEVDHAPADIDPDQRLATIVAKRRAARYRARADEWFAPPEPATSPQQPAAPVAAPSPPAPAGPVQAQAPAPPAATPAPPAAHAPAGPAKRPPAAAPAHPAPTKRLPPSRGGNP